MGIRMASGRLGGWVLVLALAACSGVGGPPLAEVPPPANGAELIRALRAGGLNIYMRHGATESTGPDADITDFQDCGRQRNLSALGRQQAAAVGQAFAALHIPVAAVSSSPYCRCRDTARLAFGDDTIEPMLLALDAGPSSKERQERVSWLLQRIRQEHAGENMVYVSHQFNIMSAANILLNEGDAAIIRPHGAAGIEVLATVSAAQWQSLAREATPR